MILAFAVAGILAAGGVYVAVPTQYASEAKLLIRYVMDTRSMAPSSDKPSDRDPQVRSPDSRGETIINSEVEILTSLDLAGEVADIVGWDKILAKLGGGSNRLSAAAVIANPTSLIVENPKNSSIIRIRFQHRDPSVVQPVLTHLIESYVKKHLEIHRGVGVLDEFLTKQTDELRSSLTTIEADLWNLKTNSGIISVDESKKALNDELARIQEGLLAAEAELAERQAGAAALGDKLQPASTNAAAELGVPADKIDEYKRVCEQLGAARKRESYKSLIWGDENPMMIGIRSLIADSDKQKKSLETEFPKLATLNLPTLASSSSSGDPRPGSFDPMAEFAHAKALEAKIKVLNAQLAQVHAQAALVDQTGTRMATLQRKKDLDEASYRYYLASREQARVDQALGPGHITNISIVQSPSAPGPALSKKSKVVLGAFGGLIALGLAIAFGLELFLDPRVKRASEVESKLHIPLFLAVPNVLIEGAALQHSDPSSSISHHPSSNPQLAPYYAAIRDRLTMYFQARNMTHKPKLVGVTSSGRHAGVTTLASGLAASLSEMGSGNVLLVDMGIPNGMAHPFHKGKPVCPLNEALEGQTRTQALVQDHLYLATPRTNGTAASEQTLAIVPAKFSAMMPRLKESDYDYIIFDLPPVNSTSPSAGLASMLDMTFLVVEAEKTNREAVKRSIAQLAVAKANVAGIMNKTRNYLPAWLHSEV